MAVAAPARADGESNGGGEEGVLGAIKSIFDPNEKTKAGKVLPKAYLKAAREVVRTLRESLEGDDGGDMAKFRRNADNAKASIREFLGGWRGQQAVAGEVALEKAIRSLAEFYSKAGPSAPLPQDVKNKILDDLSVAIVHAHLKDEEEMILLKFLYLKQQSFNNKKNDTLKHDAQTQF
ncbi:hypothetical protein HU200_004437 [Digitaria exilis]|uniref:Uncharacterized protein n=1 Tax=Digitaria exilis TaxID=1010633 RepID=A0A835KXG8_9POAL|nr:hypothetical protein HU200_004437 [Digitaria exilis]